MAKKLSAKQNGKISQVIGAVVDVEFDSMTNETHNIPGCYYEFALRHSGFDGFIAGSADKIFESTDNK